VGFHTAGALGWFTILSSFLQEKQMEFVAHCIVFHTVLSRLFAESFASAINPQRLMAINFVRDGKKIL
jgi:hypothetical protein